MFTQLVGRHHCVAQGHSTEPQRLKKGHGQDLPLPNHLFHIKLQAPSNNDFIAAPFPRTINFLLQSIVHNQVINFKKKKTVVFLLCPVF